MARHSPSWPMIFAIQLASTIRQAAALKWEICRVTIDNALGNKTLSLNDRTLFQPDASRKAPVLTLDGCYKYCGAERTWYPDVGPILNTWLIPVLILVSQMEVAASDKRTYLVILHLLGDPVDSIYSLLLKVEAWSRCSRLAEMEWDRIDRTRQKPKALGLRRQERSDHRRSQPRNWLLSIWQGIGGCLGSIGGYLARSKGDPAKTEFVSMFGTVLGGIEEIAPEGVDPIKVYRRLEHILPEVQARIPAIARELANSRTDNIYRTCLAVALYFWQVISAFISKVGGTPSSPPGGRIAISMFLTYVLPPILLSNVVASFPSQYTCYNVLQHHLPESDLLESIEASRPFKGSREAYFESRPWSGGTYTFRPKKVLFAGGHDGDRSRWQLFVLAVCPVFVSTVTGLVIMWHLPPAGPGCRWFVLLGISCVYCFSFVFTWLTRGFGLRDRLHWQLTHIKDSCIVVPALFLLFASSSGLFNTCWCWSGVWTRGRLGARIQLNTDESFRPYLDKLYPVVFASCLALQLCIFAAMLAIGRDGLGLMRWSRQRRAGLVMNPPDLGQRAIQQSNFQVE